MRRARRGLRLDPDVSAGEEPALLVWLDRQTTLTRSFTVSIPLRRAGVFVLGALVAGGCASAPPPTERAGHPPRTSDVRVVISRSDGPRGANERIVVEGGWATLIRSRGPSIGVFTSALSDADERAIVEAILSADAATEQPAEGIPMDHAAVHYTLDTGGRHVELNVTPATVATLSGAYGRVTDRMEPLRAFRIELSHVDPSPRAKHGTTARVDVVNVGTASMTLALSRPPVLWAAHPPKQVPERTTPIGVPRFRASADVGAVERFEIAPGDHHEIELSLELAEPGEYGVWATWEGVFTISGGDAKPIEAWGYLSTVPVTVEAER